MISLYRPRQGGSDALRCKLYSSAGVSLSDVLPTFEHMGAKVVDERPYRVQPEGAEPVWIYDFGLRCRAEDVEAVDEIFEAAFLDARRGRLEDDGLNALVLAAALPGREVAILRAIAKYLRQAGIAYSDAYMERTLCAHPDVARLLVKLFLVRLDPEGPDPELAERLGRAMEMAIDGVPSLDEDRILRNFLAVVARDGADQLLPRSRSEAPAGTCRSSSSPRPYPQSRSRGRSSRSSCTRPGSRASTCGAARWPAGGIRWSERPEDFRTEVLGLMKAQMIKNALIVPVGAKGGFVLKRAPSEADRLREEAIQCYRIYLSGLLDLTDNIRA